MTHLMEKALKAVSRKWENSTEIAKRVGVDPNRLGPTMRALYDKQLVQGKWIKQRLHYKKVT